MANDMGGVPRLSEPQFPSAALSKYRKHVAHLDMSETAKDELLTVVWRIMSSFVDRAFGDDPVQHVLGSVDRSAGKAAPTIPAVVESPPSHPTTIMSLSSGFAEHAAGERRKE